MGSRFRVPVVPGPLAPLAAGYASWLASREYSSCAAADRLCQLGLLSRWMASQGLGVGELTGERARLFAAARRARGVVTYSSPRSVMLPLEFLRGVGAAPEPVPAAPHGPFEVLLADYRRYLSVERGLCEHTVCDEYVPAARLFLSRLSDPGAADLSRLSAADVSGFLARECPVRSEHRARDLASALRCLLRYLHLAGLIELPLDSAVPAVSSSAGQDLPRGLEPAVVRKLLASCDRRRLLGRRDYAILLLLARLGLRAGEVAAIMLDDIDWRAGMLLVHGKGSREDTLPIPTDVGAAIAAYLRLRSRCQDRSLFLRVTAPRRGLDRCTVAWVVRAACDRVGVPRVGSHRLRHAAATSMLRSGATLVEIGQILRHREPKTTGIYAKVDYAKLAILARPWPTPAGAA